MTGVQTCALPMTPGYLLELAAIVSRVGGACCSSLSFIGPNISFSGTRLERVLGLGYN